MAYSAGDNGGPQIRGSAPGSTLRIVGATSVANITGYNAGTANTGTSSTNLAKPDGGVNWVTNALKGKWLKRVGGGGYESGGDNLRPILSNTTTTLAVNSMAGMDNTTNFRIVDLATTLDRISMTDLIALRAQNNLGVIEIVGLDFSVANTLDGSVTSAGAKLMSLLALDE